MTTKEACENGIRLNHLPFAKLKLMAAQGKLPKES